MWNIKVFRSVNGNANDAFGWGTGFSVVAQSSRRFCVGNRKRANGTVQFALKSTEI